MHLPWTQVANEVIDQAAPQLASALDWHEDLEVGEALALRGLLCFIRWALGRCPTDRPPSESALIPGTGAARLIALQMKYRGDPQALVEAMAAVRPSPIITATPEGIRVNGLDRYDQAWRKNFKDEAKAWDERTAAPTPPNPPAVSRTDSGRKTGGDRTDSARQTQMHIQNDVDVELHTAPAVPDRAFDVAGLQVLWNAAADAAGLPKWQSMPDARRRAAGARLREHPERAWWKRVLELAVQRPFLIGRGERGWRIDPDWLLKSGRAESILEGKYADAGLRARTAPPDANQGIPRSEQGPLPTAATHGAVWAAALTKLRESKPYAATQLARLRELRLSPTSIELEAPDGYVAGWAEDEYRGLLEQLLAPRAVVLCAVPGSAGPAPPLSLVSGGAARAGDTKSGGAGA